MKATLNRGKYSFGYCAISFLQGANSLGQNKLAFLSVWIFFMF